jgi:hypothetical protein
VASVTAWPGLIKQIGQTQVHKVMHFSASVSLEQLRELGGLIRGLCSAPAQTINPDRGDLHLHDASVTD